MTRRLTTTQLTAFLAGIILLALLCWLPSALSRRPPHPDQVTIAPAADKVSISWQSPSRRAVPYLIRTQDSQAVVGRGRSQVTSDRHRIEHDRLRPDTKYVVVFPDAPQQTVPVHTLPLVLNRPTRAWAATGNILVDVATNVHGPVLDMTVRGAGTSSHPVSGNGRQLISSLLPADDGSFYWRLLADDVTVGAGRVWNEATFTPVDQEPWTAPKVALCWHGAELVLADKRKRCLAYDEHFENPGTPADVLRPQWRAYFQHHSTAQEPVVLLAPLSNDLLVHVSYTRDGPIFIHGLDLEAHMRRTHSPRPQQLLSRREWTTRLELPATATIASSPIVTAPHIFVPVELDGTTSFLKYSLHEETLLARLDALPGPPQPTIVYDGPLASTVVEWANRRWALTDQAGMAKLLISQNGQITRFEPPLFVLPRADSPLKCHGLQVIAERYLVGYAAEAAFAIDLTRGNVGSMPSDNDAFIAWAPRRDGLIALAHASGKLSLLPVELLLTFRSAQLSGW